MFQGNGSCLLRMKEALNDLTPKEAVAASYILQNPKNAINLSIHQLAKDAEVSTSTLLRLCRSLHFNSYKSFSQALFADLSHPVEVTAFESIHPGASPQEVMHHMYLSTTQVIKKTMSIQLTDQLDAAVDAICRTKKLYFYGMGSSGLVAADASMKFMRCGITSFAFSSTSDMILSSLSLQPDDVAFIISYTGNTTDVVNITHDIKKTKAKIITLTRYGRNAISELGDITLFSYSSESLKHSGAMSSRIAQLFVIDVLYAAVCSRMFDTVKDHLENARTTLNRLHNESTNDVPY